MSSNSLYSVSGVSKNKRRETDSLNEQSLTNLQSALQKFIEIVANNPPSSDMHIKDT